MGIFWNYTIAIFTVNFSHLNYNVIQHGCEVIFSISSSYCVIVRVRVVLKRTVIGD